MIRTATRDDLPALRALFAAANEMPYDLSAVAEEKCFGDGLSGAATVRMFEDAGAAVTCGRWLRILAVHPDARRRGIGSALLADAESRGARVIAAESGNYFTPGVLESQRAFFEKRGYDETAFTHNLEVELPVAGDPLRSATRATHQDRERVLAFVEQHFGRIWRFEAAKAFERELPPCFIEEEGGAISGFAVHDVNNRGLGWFGPTGVAQAMRGRGTGCRLLRASLADLHRLGCTRGIIPWTDALAFYDKCCGAKPAHRYFTLAR
jgi:GNAT superfamily N-acetyltransferase